MLVKAFGKAKNINNAGDSTISSYAYSLMAISYLQSRAIIPKLQGGAVVNVVVPDIPTKRRGKGTSSLRVVDVGFEKVEDRVFEDIDFLSSDGVGSLFCDFLEYVVFKHNLDLCFSVRDGGIVKGITSRKKVLQVLDPFEDDRNCTRMVSGDGLNRVMKGFRQGIACFRNGDIKGLFS